MANIAKIKADLRLDAFLPHDDPRNSAEDITEKFDTIFWCGDLNFRLDMSRLHAEWLVEQKKYQEALTWDQLKLVMADPNLNPFPGFEEGPIDFPPTFKYDVWRSIKATNRDLRKSIKRRGSDAKSIREGKEAVVGSARSTGPLSHLAEEITEDDLESEEENGTNPPSSYRRSLESNRTRGGPPSLAGTDGDELSEGSPNPGLSQSALNSAYNSHRPLDIAIKEKTKKFFNVVKLGVSGQSSSSLARRISLRRSSARKQEDVDAPLAPPHPVYHDADLASRRTSLSSAISITDEASSREDAQRVPPLLIPGAAHGAPDRGMLAASPMSIEGDSRLRAESVTSSAPFSSSPPNGQPRKFGLKRTVSGKSFKGSTSIDDDDARGSIDMEEDTREGVYDTSKKQRVPSWVSMRHGGLQHPCADGLAVRPSFMEGTYRAGPGGHSLGTHAPWRLSQAARSLVGRNHQLGRSSPLEHGEDQHARARDGHPAPLVLQRPQGTERFGVQCAHTRCLPDSFANGDARSGYHTRSRSARHAT